MGVARSQAPIPATTATPLKVWSGAQLVNDVNDDVMPRWLRENRERFFEVVNIRYNVHDATCQEHEAPLTTI